MLFAWAWGDWAALAFCFIGWWVTLSHYDGRASRSEEALWEMLFWAGFWIFLLWAISKYTVHGGRI